MKNYSLLQVYTGSGKGKTTAALGGLCATGREQKHSCCHFSKMIPTIMVFEAYGNYNTFHIFTEEQVGRDAFIKFS